MSHLQVKITSTPASRGVLLSLSFAMFMASLGTSIANVALPTLAHSFGVSFQAVQWVVIVYLLTITASVVSVGRLGDLIGRRRLMLAGLAVFTLASAGCAMSPDLWVLIAARVVQGVGSAIMMALTMALVGEVMPREKSGSAMGLLGTLSAVGTALGPTLGGLLIGAWGWQAVFWLNVPLGMMTFGLAWHCLPRAQSCAVANQVRFDYVGTILLTLALTGYAMAMTLGQGRMSLANVALLVAALLALGGFVRVEAVTPSPLIQLDLFRHPVIGLGFVSCALATVVVMTTLVVGPFYLAGVFGLSAAHMGLVMSIGPAVAALVGAPAGRLVDRQGTHRVAVVALAAMLLGTVALPVASLTWGVVGYAGMLAMITGGYAAFQAANNTAVMGSASPDQRGLVSGLLNLSRNLGLITGASAMGAVFHHGTAADRVTAASAQALSDGMGQTFMVAGVLVAAAGCCSLLGRHLSMRPVRVAEEV